MSNTESKLMGHLKKQQQTFVASALKAESEVTEHGFVYDAEEVFRYIKAKIEGRHVQRPQAVTLR